MDKHKLAIITAKLASLLPDTCYFGFHDKDYRVQSDDDDPSANTADVSAQNVVIVPGDTCDSCAFTCFHDISSYSCKEMMDIYCDRL